jgi:phosphohistidine phosphatase
VRRLWLLRHAKSSWDEQELADRDRPLATRGEHDADRMGEHLAKEQVQPALILCSSALRARQTLARVLPFLGDELDVRIEPGLYVFDPSPLLRRLREVPEDAASVLLVGHNPAMQELTLTLTAQTEGAIRQQVEAKFPTGALVGIDLRVDAWPDVAPGVGEVVRFVSPRALA